MFASLSFQDVNVAVIFPVNLRRHCCHWLRREMSGWHFTSYSAASLELTIINIQVGKKVCGRLRVRKKRQKSRAIFLINEIFQRVYVLYFLHYWLHQLIIWGFLGMSQIIRHFRHGASAVWNPDFHQTEKKFLHVIMRSSRQVNIFSVSWIKHSSYSRQPQWKPRCSSSSSACGMEKHYILHEVRIKNVPFAHNFTVFPKRMKEITGDWAANSITALYCIFARFTSLSRPCYHYL